MDADEEESRLESARTARLRLALDRLSALDRHRLAIAVLDHSLPPATGIDGLLGLDFLRGSVLTVDFQAGRVSLA
ncbi:MAG: hypothetical protein P4L84_16065 [Isosphaeraceae bacterium]|nr:hypothetical protein [Isosphaeraceae bacterium]